MSSEEEQMRTQTAKTLTLAFWEPEQRSQACDPWTSNLWNCETRHRCCSKLLTKCSSVMQQQKMHTSQIPQFSKVLRKSFLLHEASPHKVPRTRRAISSFLMLVLQPRHGGISGRSTTILSTAACPECLLAFSFAYSSPLLPPCKKLGERYCSSIQGSFEFLHNVYNRGDPTIGT